VDIGNVVESNEWAIVEHPAEKKTRKQPSYRNPHPMLVFSIKIKRVAVFYTYILVIPCLLLSFLTLVIFWLPPESPAKMILGNISLTLYRIQSKYTFSFVLFISNNIYFIFCCVACLAYY